MPRRRAEREARLQQPLFVMADEGHLHLGLRLPVGCAARWHRPRELDRHPDQGGCPTGLSSTQARLPATECGSSCATADGNGPRSTVTSTPRGVSRGSARDGGRPGSPRWANRGNSTGPHLHFEVLLGGTQRVDPVPWLAKTGPQRRHLRRLTSDRPEQPPHARPTETPSGPVRAGNGPDSAPQTPHHPASADGAAAADGGRRPHHPDSAPSHRLPATSHRAGTTGAATTLAGEPGRSTAVAASAVSIISGWATSVVATDLIAGWWKSDRLFCVAGGVSCAGVRAWPQYPA